MVNEIGTPLLERIEERDGSAVIASTGVAVAAIVERLDKGESVASLGIPALDLIAAIVHEGTRGEGLPLVQASPPHPRLQHVLSEPSITVLFPLASRPACLGLSAGLLQIHDFWEQSHTAAQLADDLGERKVSSYWHAIAHRREPDPGNAAYWFRRVGDHPVSHALARAALPVLESRAPDLASQLVRGDRWDSLAFVSICDPQRAEVADLARKIQALEMRLLIAASLP